MSYAYQQAPEQAPAQTQEAPAQQAGPAAGQSNAAQAEETGLIGGLAASAMDLTGPMAEMILECMPIERALEAAKPHLNNPIVVKWVEKIDLGSLIGNLGSRAIAHLKALWPVGTGVDAEGEIAGTLVVGASILGKAKVVRSSDSTIQATVDLHQALDLSAGGGAELTNAFDDRVVGVLAKIGASIGLRSNHQLTLDIDWLQLLAASAELGKLNMVQVLNGELSGRGALDLVAPHALLQKLVNMTEGAQWTSQDAVELMASGEAGAGLAPDVDTLALAFPQSFPRIGKLVLAFAPMLDAAAGFGIRLIPNNFPTVGVEVSGALSGMAQILSSVPGLGGALDGTALEAMQGAAAAGISATMRYDVVVGTNGVMAGDPSTATMTLSASTESDGVAVEDGVAIPLSEIGTYLQAGGDLDAILAAGAAPDITRTVGIDVPVSQLKEIFPGWIENVIGGADVPNLTEQVLRLEGSATLPGWALSALQGRGIQVPGGALAVAGLADIAASAIGMHMGGGRGAVPDWLAGHEDALVGMSLNVQMTEARLVGHIHLGLGLGLAGETGAKVEGEGRAEGGLAVDKAVEGAQARQILRALASKEAA